MTVRKTAIRDSARIGSPRMRAKRGGAWLFALLTLGTGAAAGMAALVATTLLAAAQTLASDFAPYDYSASPIEATTLFPPVPAVHKVVNVYDPPPARSFSPPARLPGTGGTRSEDGTSETEPPGGDD
jgi:hypothetical protein